MTTLSGRALLLLAMLFAFGAGPAFAQEQDAHGEAADADHEEGVFDPVHHVGNGDAVEFFLGIEIPLPRILIVRNNDGSIAPKFYASTHSAIESGDFHLAPEHPAVKGIDEEEMLDSVEAADSHDAAVADDAHAADEHADGAAGDEEGVEHEPVLAYANGEVLMDLSITRHLLFAWIVMVLLYVVLTRMARKYQQGVGRESAPKGKTQNMIETFVLFVRDDIARPNIGDKAPKYTPYLLSVFFFILTANLFGLLPFSATSTSNITVTATLAILTFIVTQLAGTKDYWKHLAGPPGVPLLVRPLLIPVEILGLFTKPFALAVRLFANMTAGHIVILSLIGLIFTFTEAYGPAVGTGTSVVWVAFTLFILCLELLVAFLQAYIFTMLSALFIGMAAEEHDHEHEHEEAHA